MHRVNENTTKVTIKYSKWNYYEKFIKLMDTEIYGATFRIWGVS